MKNLLLIIILILSCNNCSIKLKKTLAKCEVFHTYWYWIDSDTMKQTIIYINCGKSIDDTP